ncbi:MAG: hypothetical protein U1F43_17060 [Myxococcota bacterium]
MASRVPVDRQSRATSSAPAGAASEPAPRTALQRKLRGASYAEGAAALAPVQMEAAAAAPAAKAPPLPPGSEPDLSRIDFPSLFSPDGTIKGHQGVFLADPQAEVTGLVIDATGLALGGGIGQEITFGEGKRDPRDGQIRVQGAMGRIPMLQLYDQPDVGKNALHIRARAIAHEDVAEEICLDQSTRILVDLADAWRHSGFLAAGRVRIDG